MSEPEPRTKPHDDAPVTASRSAKGDRALLAESVTINRNADELFAFWRDPANLAEIMENILSIEPLGRDRSKWTVKGPGGREVSWTSVITAERPSREITWKSEDGADIANSGRITFDPVAARGTVVRAVIAYEPPAGAIGKLVAKLFQREPRIQTRRDLRRFKQLMETGEIATGARNARIRQERGEEISA